MVQPRGEPASVSKEQAYGMNDGAVDDFESERGQVMRVSRD